MCRSYHMMENFRISEKASPAIFIQWLFCTMSVLQGKAKSGLISLPNHLSSNIMTIRALVAPPQLVYRPEVPF